MIKAERLAGRYAKLYTVPENTLSAKQVVAKKPGWRHGLQVCRRYASRSALIIERKGRKPSFLLPLMPHKNCKIILA
jgi:hypothetical protein